MFANGPLGQRRGTARSSSFNINADGRVDPESITLTPDVPEPFRACFVEHIADLTLADVGPDGAHVEMPLSGPRNRGGDPRGFGGDGGVPMPSPSPMREAAAP